MRGDEVSERIQALPALRAFEVAARHGSFTLAAQRLAMTQGAVSQHVKTLENLFGCALFERHGSRLELTAHGRLLARELTPGFKLIEQACSLLRQDRQAVRLKAPSTLSVRWLLRTLDAFRQQGETVPVQLTSVWMDIDTVDFCREPYDCAILLGRDPASADIASARLFDEWLVPVCSPGYLAGLEATSALLQQCQLLHPSPDRRDWRRWLARTGRRREGIERGQVFDTLDQGISAAEQGLGIAVVDLTLVAAQLQAGRLVLPFRQAVASGDGYYLSWLKTSPKAGVMGRLRDFLVDQAPVLAWDGLERLEG